MDRRRFLAVVACGAGTTTGCLSAGEPNGTATETTSGAVRPESTPEAIPAADPCEDETATRLPSVDEETAVSWGDAGQFTLRVDGLAFEYGDTATVTLTNTGSEPNSTGNRTKYALELKTDEGWRNVRASLGSTPRPYEDDAVTHKPGTGFTWELTLTEEGITDAPTHDESLRVCPDLRTGRYRFVYWGTIGDDPLAVAFDLRGAE